MSSWAFGCLSPRRPSRHRGLFGRAALWLGLAGAPLTSGWLAKTALKAGLTDLPPPWAAAADALLPLAAAGTTLLMARLLWLAARLRGKGAAGGLAPVWLTWTLAGLALHWALLPAGAAAGSPRLPLMAPALWPLALGLALAGLAAVARLRLPAVPAGDLIVPIERLPAALGRLRSGHGGNA